MLLDIDMAKLAEFIAKDDLGGAVQMVLDQAAEYIRDMDKMAEEVEK